MKNRNLKRKRRLNNILLNNPSNLESYENSLCKLKEVKRIVNKAQRNIPEFNDGTRGITTLKFRRTETLVIHKSYRRKKALKHCKDTSIGLTEYIKPRYVSIDKRTKGICKRFADK